MHNAGYTHLDVRLPNICFDEQYKAVSIDFDRAFDASAIKTRPQQDAGVPAEKIVSHILECESWRDNK